MINRHGLDARYFKEKLGQLVRDADYYTPAEMDRALTRLAKVAGSQDPLIKVSTAGSPLKEDV